jgi:hypothetical protein
MLLSNSEGYVIHSEARALSTSVLFQMGRSGPAVDNGPLDYAEADVHVLPTSSHRYRQDRDGQLKARGWAGRV